MSPAPMSALLPRDVFLRCSQSHDISSASNRSLSSSTYFCRSGSSWSASALTLGPLSSPTTTRHSTTTNITQSIKLLKHCPFSNFLEVPKKGKGSPYWITERRVPELIQVLGSQPAGDVNHKPGGRLPLLSTMPTVTPNPQEGCY